MQVSGQYTNDHTFAYMKLSWLYDLKGQSSWTLQQWHNQQ